jgi:Trypsin-like peptidase domain
MTDSATSLTELYQSSSHCVVAFINKLQQGIEGQPPLFPHIIGTGWFANAKGLVVTNRHVVQAIDALPAHPTTRERMGGALLFLLDEHRQGCQLMSIPIISTYELGEFSSNDDWYGQDLPDIGFVQLAIRENSFLELAIEKFALKPGMEISTIGWPMGSLPLTVHQKVNQISPFIRRGIVSSVYPGPIANPHGFTIDVMQQGGSSGSPIFGPDNRRVVGMMWGAVNDNREATSDQGSFVYTSPTNISLAEPAYIIAGALKAFTEQMPPITVKIPTLTERRAIDPQSMNPTGMPWEVLP